MCLIRHRANSVLDRAMSGILSYQALGVPNDKLVLGLPWYGYHYPCLQYLAVSTITTITTAYVHMKLLITSEFY